jgi:hypothetical protein
MLSIYGRGGKEIEKMRPPNREGQWEGLQRQTLEAAPAYILLRGSKVHWHDLDTSEFRGSSGTSQFLKDPTNKQLRKDHTLLYSDNVHCEDTLV